MEYAHEQRQPEKRATMGLIWPINGVRCTILMQRECAHVVKSKGTYTLFGSVRK